MSWRQKRSFPRSGVAIPSLFVSAITGEGIDQLPEAVLLQAELLELTAVEDGPAQVVIEPGSIKAKGLLPHF